MADLPRKRSSRLTREQRVSEILRAAREAFRESGYEGTTVAEIAARLGVVEGLIYKHFDSKRSLLNRVLEQWYEGLYEDYAHNLSGIRGYPHQLRYLIWRHVRTLGDDPQICRLVLKEVRAEPNYLDSELHHMNRRYTQLLVDVLQNGIRHGEFRRELPLPLVRDMVYGCVEHHLWGFLYGQSRLDPDRLADQITELLCSGILARTAAVGLGAQTERLATLVDRVEIALESRGATEA
ncbi:MAG: TetR/AcrR family transcriptional regulator, fatty acid metabolism regulator protein [Gammaproteobacteria bacterium]|nr:TetR/AcrR family transcriptional regulator, fatty acid metabolism regulator protein [Gammaproteobacteria bacterium]